jgi:AraC-like DNA-binding protein
VLAAEDWADFDALARRRVVDLAVADPTIGGGDAVATLERLSVEFPTLPLIVYTSLSSGTLNAVVRLARSGIEHVVLFRFDDEPSRFRRLLEGVPGHALGERMLHLLAEPIGRLPVAVAKAVEVLFKTPGRIQGTDDLAQAAGMNTRTLYRHLERVGFYSPRSLVVASRLIRVHAYLRDPGRSIKDVAAQAGYRSSFLLNRQMREMTGKTTEQARRELDGDELVSILARRVQERRKQPGTDEADR